jgi:hypothetical protein
MPKKSPWYSVKLSDPRVYHDNSNCDTGNNIEKENVRQGTDNRPLCKDCKGLAEKGK